MTRRSIIAFIFMSLSVLTALPASAQTYINSVEPATAQAGTTQSVVIYGSLDCTFSVWGSVVTFEPATQITHGEVSLLAYNILETELTIPSNASGGIQTVTVTTDDIAQCTGVAVFEVVCNGCGSASLSAVNPSRGDTGQTLDIAVTGAGTNFDATSQLSFSGSGVTVNSVSASSATSLQASISIASDTPEGPRSLTVTTGAEVATGQDLFQVICATCTHPVLDRIQPSVGRPDQTVQVTVFGLETSFDQTSQLNLTGSGIVVSDVSASDATTLQATLTIAADAQEGMRDITVTTGSEVARGYDLFEVVCTNCDAARLLSCTPDQAYTGQTLDIEIAGEETSFDGSSVLTFSGSGITVQTVSAPDGLTLAATITIAPDASLGDRDLTVVTGAQTATGATLFSVSEQPLSVSPDNGIQGDTLATITLSGGNLALTSVSSVDLGTGLSIGSFNAPEDATLILSDVAIAPDAPVGLRDITLDLAGGSQTFPAVFAVLQGSGTSLLLLDPDHGDRGHPGLAVDLSGQNTHFDADELRLTFSGEGVMGAFEEADSSTQMTARLVIAQSATEDARDVYVEAGGACTWAAPTAPCERVGLPGAFTVTPPGSIDSVSPTVLPAGESTTVTLLATDGQFVDGQTELVFDPPEGLAAEILSVASPDELQVQLQVASDASGQVRDILSVTGPEVAIGSGLLDINNPEIVSVIPSAGIRGISNFPVTLRAIDIPFTAATVAQFSGEGLTVDSVSFDPNEPDQLVLSVSISLEAERGYRNLTVREGAIEETLERAFQILVEGQGDEDSGCNCATQTPGPGAILALLFLLVALGRRRFSSYRRR